MLPPCIWVDFVIRIIYITIKHDPLMLLLWSSTSNILLYCFFNHYLLILLAPFLWSCIISYLWPESSPHPHLFPLLYPFLHYHTHYHAWIGHKGSVNDVIFNPVRPDVIASCGSDKQIFLGELVWMIQQHNLTDDPKNCYQKWWRNIDEIIVWFISYSPLFVCFT